MSTRRSIERERMYFASQFIKGGQLDDVSKAKKFESYVHKMPAFIMTNGLGNTLAYINTQSDAQWGNVKTVICHWLAQVENPLKSKIPAQNAKVDDLLKALREEQDGITDREYRAVTIEVLALLNWLRRLAKGHRLAIDTKNNG